LKIPLFLPIIEPFLRNSEKKFGKLKMSQKFLTRVFAQKKPITNLQNISRKFKTLTLKSFEKLISSQNRK